jgi:hypothetical protein
MAAKVPLTIASLRNVNWSNTWRTLSLPNQSSADFFSDTAQLLLTFMNKTPELKL